MKPLVAFWLGVLPSGGLVFSRSYLQSRLKAKLQSVQSPVAVNSCHRTREIKRHEMKKSSVVMSCAFLVLFIGCANRQPIAQPPAANTPKADKAEITLTSIAFKEGQSIPRTYTCDGVNISPPLEWTGVPRTATTVAIIVDDPDAPAGTWVHWVLYNLPADNIGVVENVPASENLKAGGFQGKNDFVKFGYGGSFATDRQPRYISQRFVFAREPR